MISKTGTKRKAKQEQKKLSPVQKEKLINSVIIWIMDGIHKGKIFEMISSHSPVKVNAVEANQLLAEAILKFGERIHQKDLETINCHVDNCERIHDYFKKVDNALAKNKALKHKERLIGVLKGIKLVINHTKITTIEPDVQYDLNKLTPEERKELDELLKIASA